MLSEFDMAVFFGEKSDMAVSLEICKEFVDF